MMLDDDGQVCLVPSYGRTHKDACLKRLEQAPEAQERLSQLLLAQ
jgi:hypothetical protein